MKKKILVWSFIYFVGIVLLLISGLQAINWLVYLSVILGIAGIVYALVANRE